MKKILTTLLFFVCCSGIFAQYMPGGIVSQGTLMSTETEIIRSGFDVWAGGGIGFCASTSLEDFGAVAYHIDINAGYNVSPKLFLGAGLNTVSTISNATAVYVNLRPYLSRSLNSLYWNLFLGKVISGNTIVADDEDWRHAQFYKQYGMMGGITMGYAWNHFALEFGFNLSGGRELYVDSRDYSGSSFSEVIEDPSLLDWKDGDGYGDVLLGAFVRTSWRF